MKQIIFAFIAMAIATFAMAQYQLPNPGFEHWDGGNTSEPTHWNSFASSDGSYASLASSPHHYRRSGGRPGSQGHYYLTIYTKSILGIKANGNMTTGRIHAGSMSASSSDNYNYTQRSNADHCQPFVGTPDSVYLWVSYYASSSSSKGQVTFMLHGDNDFRSPNQENSTNLYCGKALHQFSRTTSSASSPRWQQLKIPFVYNGTSEAAYMLVNLTTNAQPGGGSSNDSLSVDDIEFIYSSWLNAILVAGAEIEQFDKTQMDYILRTENIANIDTSDIRCITEASDASYECTRSVVDDTTIRFLITVTAEDGISTHTYSITLLSTSNDDIPQLSIPLVEQPQKSQLRVYPNPAADYINIEAEGTVSLFDVNGRLVRRRSVFGSECIDIADLPSGVYFVVASGSTLAILKP